LAGRPIKARSPHAILARHVVNAMRNEDGPLVRRSIRVRGVVQGVGFRPSMLRLARSLEVSGFVRNDEQGVLIEVEGSASRVARFASDIAEAAPSHARIEAIDCTIVSPRGDADFACAPTEVSASGRRSAAIIPVDLPPCDDCIRDIEDPDDARFGYPFVACTACGPRFTVVSGMPYDRERTTMRDFAPCDSCRREYADPADRRFHSEANACPRCGPRLRLVRPGADDGWGDDALAQAVRALAQGAIVAVKGVGGFVLAVDATREEAVARLRVRKRRPHRPLAVMARDLASLERIAAIDDEARRALASPARPIVLLPKRPHSPLAPSVAPGLAEVGAFLPPSPLQHLVLSRGPSLQVMTSGNRAGDPIATSNHEALARLRDVADLFLLHDRDVQSGADDSVVRVVAGAPVPLRRARGFVPEALAIPIFGPPVLAVGGELKATICFAEEGKATLSPHLGDLHQPETYERFVRSIEDLQRLVGVKPAAVAHDQHPEYRSTRWADECGLPRVAVQHHHAHVAACMAEHGRTERVIGVAFDGLGYGSDGTLWGGEFLEADLRSFRRLGHLGPLRLPGGEQAVREPWRIAAAALLDAGEDPKVLEGVERSKLRSVCELILAKTAAPACTSAGRWFDVAAALLGFHARTTYEGQAAVELEARAAPDVAAPYDVAVTASPGAPFVVDLRGVVQSMVVDLRRGALPSRMAARFHESMARAVVLGCRQARLDGSAAVVALTGGCFQNRRFTERAKALLEEDGFLVLVHRRVPPNDGGLSFGQAAVAACRLGGP
jgi:hydrogenase maturation protein HypF